MWQKILAKVLSARFLMAVGFSSTYCIIMALLTVALLKKIITVETYVALLGAFALIVREIVQDYFDREDRKNEPTPKPKDPNTP